jgi:pyridoxine/pyridoxamine 5'-phosphate oxidase
MPIGQAALYSFMDACSLAVVASVSKTKEPQAALIGIAVTPDLEIVFDTVKSSRKYRNLISDANAALVIGWAGETTVQYEGRAEELTGAPLERYKKTYFAKWPDCREHERWPDMAYFVVRPKWIRYSDFNQNPPDIQEFTY